MSIRPVPNAARETPLERVARLQSDAKSAALALVDEMFGELGDLSRRLGELADLEPIPAGIRGEFAQLSEVIRTRLQSATNLRARV